MNQPMIVSFPNRTLGLEISLLGADFARGRAETWPWVIPVSTVGELYEAMGILFQESHRLKGKRSPPH